MRKKILTALITPFDNDFHIDFPALKSIIKQQMDNGADGFIVCGTTSEAPTLTMDEQTEIIETVLSMTKGNYLVYAGAGTNCTATTISNIHAWNHFDLDGYLLTTPYYNRPSEEGLYHHFALAAASTDKEIMLYHIPSRTASSISLSLAKRLVKDCPNIRSIKYADADYHSMLQIKEQDPAIALYSGDDISCIQAMKDGMDGVISVMSHIVLPAMRQTLDQDLLYMEDDLCQLARYCFIESSPAPVKYMLAEKQCCRNILRLPMYEVKCETKRILKEQAMPLIDKINNRLHV